MAVNTKLTTIQNGVLGIRQAIKNIDPSLANGSVTTLGDDIRTLNKRKYVCKWVNDGENFSLKRDINETDNITIRKYINDSSIRAVILPEQIKTINEAAFRYCTSLQYINLTNVESIATRGFSDGGKLSSAIMPNIKTIGTYAFYCQPLTYVEIGENVTSISDYAFYTDVASGSYVTNRVFVIRATTPISINSEAFRSFNNSWIYDNLTIYVPYGCGNTYKTATNWNTYASIIQELNEDGSIPS